MAKNSKKSKEATAPENPASAPNIESSNGHSAAESAKPAAAKKRAAKAVTHGKSAGKGRAATVKKPSATRKPRAKKTAESGSTPAVADEQIRMRAYFISEWRAQNGMPGDSAHDWLEARRQLQAEASLA
ncbi:MAG: DUF2934 domain-containing protein [Chthoniobacterales bacterium]|nr:DUF2934 domain-containing protein [Chthoniobacterales bacterium]